VGLHVDAVNDYAAKLYCSISRFDDDQNVVLETALTAGRSSVRLDGRRPASGAVRKLAVLVSLYCHKLASTLTATEILLLVPYPASDLEFARVVPVTRGPLPNVNCSTLAIKMALPMKLTSGRSVG
jgi:hypothetical protein